MRTLSRLLWIVCATVVPLHCSSSGAERGRITSIVIGSGSVTLTWEDLHAPYLVRTSSDLFDWRDQGGIGDIAGATLAAEQSPAFYRVRHLNPANELGNFYGLILTEQGESGGGSWAGTV